MASSLKVNRIVPSTGTNIGFGTANGQIRLASTSKLTFDGDTDTYIHHPSANQLAITRAGASFPIIRFGSGGGGNTVTIGNTDSNLVTNGEILSVRGYSSFKSVSTGYSPIYTHNEGNTSGTFNPHLLFNAGGANRGGFGYMPNTGELTLNHQYDFTVRTGSGHLGGAERLRINSDGRILVGAGGTVTPRIVSTSVNAFTQIEGTTYHQSALSITRNTDDQWGGYIIIGKSRGTSVGGIGTLTDNDIVGEFRFAACDGTDMVPMTALIRSEIDGAVGVNSTPGALTFRTTSPGNVSTNERLRIAADGNITTDYNIKSNNLRAKNLIINGAMQVAQYGTSISAEGYSVDRWNYLRSGINEELTLSQHALTSSDTGPWEEGFRYSLHFQNGNQTGGAGASDYAIMRYKVEAQDLAQSGWNYTSSNSYITLSYWIKSSVAQSFPAYMRSHDGTARVYSWDTGTLTQNTWTKITKTIPGNSGLTINNDNGIGMLITFPGYWGGTWTDNGVTYDTWRAWGSGNERIKDYTTSWWTTNDATLEITGVQLELGSSATKFEHLTYAEDLWKCKRYYNEVANTRDQGGNDCTLGMFCQVYDSTGAHIIHQLNPPMRKVPDLRTVDSSGSYILIVGNSSDTFDEIIENSKSRWTNQNVELWCQTGLSGLTPGHAAFVRLRSAVSTTVVAFDAEL